MKKTEMCSNGYDCNFLIPFTFERYNISMFPCELPNRF